ncbi:MAG: aspartate aminotransferase family protein [Candidatus Thorarchaeota archaeon]|nr:aspartate aminotransferase family protein [Candidatus Thorarchaeota archaeon]
MNFIGKIAKEKAIEDFAAHVSSGKADFYGMVDLNFILGKREGPWMWDVSGDRRLLNCHCNGGVFNLGHRHPEILRVMKAAMEELDIGNHHLMSEQRAILGRKLAELTPPEITRTVFGVGGGEAIDFAIKLARAHIKKHKIIYATSAYHGHTGFALAAGDKHFKDPFGPLAPGFIDVPFGDANAVARAIDDKTAAVLFETIPATLGMPLPPDDFYKNVREICDEKGVLLIFDEIQTGLGRTGKLWAFEHYDVVPDIFTIGKGLSGGLYPITATCYREDLDSFMNENPFIHVSTFGGAEIGCPVAMKVLDIVSGENFLRHVNEIGDSLTLGLQNLKEQYSDILVEIRRKGLFMGLKMSDTGYGPLMSIAGYNCGVFAVYADNDRSVLQFLPPLIIGDDEVSYLLDAMDRAYQYAKERPDYLELARNLAM